MRQRLFPARVDHCRCHDEGRAPDGARSGSNKAAVGPALAGRPATLATAARALGAALLALALAPGVAFGATPSFDCAKAASWSEKYLCGDDDLAALDRQMAALYSEARANATEGEKTAMTGEQRAWLRQREGCKGKAKEWTCLRQLYGSRIARLTAGGPTPATEASGDSAAVAGGASAALPETVLLEDPRSSTEPVATDGGDARSPAGALPAESAVPARAEPTTTPPLTAEPAVGPPLGSDTCKQTFHEIPIGGQACGIELTPDRRVLAGDVEIPNVFANNLDTPPDSLKLIVLPSSPGGRYSVVKACAEECGGLFVVDHARGGGRSFQGALYGPANWIAWTEDEQYFLLQNYDDGVNWLQLVHLPEGRIENLSSFDTDFAALMNAEESFAWLGPRRFKVALMDACMEGSCGNLEYPRDLTRVEFEIAGERLEVKSIEDPRKVPAVLRDALQARQTRVELADGTVLNGEVSAGTLTFASSLGTVQVPLQDIQSYKDEAATLNDGSVLKGRFGEGAMEISTSRGALKVPAQDVVAIARGKPGPAPAAGGSASPAPGQGVLIGRVLDNFKKPVGNATVRILGSALEARTDRDGRYRLNYVPGQLQVAIQAPGHDPMQFGLALSAPTEYPVEDKVLLRLPSGPGVFYWAKDGWSALNECNLKLVRAIDRGNLDCVESQKETYAVKGDPLRIGHEAKAVFFDNRARGSSALSMFRVSNKEEIVTDIQPCGLAGFGAMFEGTPSKSTSHIRHAKQELFSGRAFLVGDFAPGVYAIANLPNTCFKFQIGPNQPQAESPPEKSRAAAKTLLVDGKTVRYWPGSSGSNKEAYFQMENKGYRNTYKLDCAGRRFRWTENMDLATGIPTDNALGAEWKPLNPNSTTANAVYDAICPALLKSK